MMWRRGIVAALVVAGALFALPCAAAAHAYLVRTVPAASVVLDSPPPNIELTYDEVVEPRLAIISVTDAQGHQETIGPVHRSPASPDTLLVPLRAHLPEGWYLIYWRAISVDGHPVQEAFTYAVGPNPGPAPEFRVPRISATAATPQLLIARCAPNGYSSRVWPAGEIARLGVPGIRFSDGPRGVILDGATTFPVSMARGATFDTDLEERVGDAIGRELRALGGNYFGGVCINLLRHPAWGRAQETYGEDPSISAPWGRR